MKSLISRIARSRVWRSIFRTGLPDSNLKRAEVIFNSLILHIHPVKVRARAIRFSYSLYLGGLAFGLFLALIATGVLLMLYYHPSVPQAYRDMKDLQFVVSSGTFLRNMHRWAAHGMVAIVILHMLRVFYAGAYRPPREFNWVVGVVLLLLTLLLSYTGYLLPWDQLAFWGVSVGTNIAQATPFIGPKLRFLLLGGHVVGENALLRFYVLHCVFLPLALTFLIGIHFWRIRKDGGLAVDKQSGDQNHE